MTCTELFSALAKIPSVSGFEADAGEALNTLFGERFDEYLPLLPANHLFVRRCGKENAAKLMIDCHFDEVGFIVNQMRADGILGLSAMGGPDPLTLGAGAFTVYANTPIPAVMQGAPVTMGSSRKAVPTHELQLFTGYSEAQLREMGVEIGTPVGYATAEPLKLKNDRIACKSADNKTSIAAAVRAIELLADAKLNCDIYLLLSCEEESYMAGARTGTYAVMPDAALVVDVDFGTTPDVGKNKAGSPESGPSIPLSIQTDRTMTLKLMEIAKEKEIPSQQTICPLSTGTNARAVAFAREGVPTAVLGVPLQNMHTGVEVFSEMDLENTAKLIAAYIEATYSEEVAQ